MPTLIVWRNRLRDPYSQFTVRVRELEDTRVTAPSPDQAIGQLVLEHRELWGKHAGKIVTSGEAGNYCAFLDRWTNDVCGFGITREEAIGALIRTHCELFGTEIRLSAVWPHHP